MGTEGILGFVVGFYGIGEEQAWGLDMITDRNPDLGFTAYDIIHGIKINIKSK